ncbi:MAG: hypothetical protein HYY91_02940 [Candidatus Omnitrophica bacterium]|nr:hypothetical protein [Candidatus Omnitrophota bacterium]
MSALHADLTKKCKRFVLSHWGEDGLEQVQERPVTWALYQANPHLKLLRRKHKHLPLITIQGGANRIRLALSTERSTDGSLRGR